MQIFIKCNVLSQILFRQLFHPDPDNENKETTHPTLLFFIAHLYCICGLDGFYVASYFWIPPSGYLAKNRKHVNQFQG